MLQVLVSLLGLLGSPCVYLTHFVPRVRTQCNMI